MGIPHCVSTVRGDSFHAHLSKLPHRRTSQTVLPYKQLPMAVRDPADIYTRGGTPIIMVFSRIAFLGYFIFAFATLLADRFPHSQVEPVWLAYQIGLYLFAERLFVLFGEKGIDLTYAFPILFAAFILNFVTQILGGQDQLPLMNRTEHFASFVLITYVVWTFFLKYLPHNVWHDHPYYTALLVLSVTSLMGVSNELIELLIDRIFGTNHIGNQYDTALDLLMNTLGGGLFLAVRLILGTVETSQK